MTIDKPGKYRVIEEFTQYAPYGGEQIPVGTILNVVKIVNSQAVWTDNGFFNSFDRELPVKPTKEKSDGC